MAVICISRGTFSGGEAVAQQWPNGWDTRVSSREANLARAAARYHIPAEASTATLEKRPSFWDKVLGERDLYLLCVRAALFEQAQGGQLVLSWLSWTVPLAGGFPVLRVRVIADQEFRLRAVMEQQHLPKPEALAHIKRVDQKRREWTRFLFDVDGKTRLCMTWSST